MRTQTGTLTTTSGAHSWTGNHKCDTGVTVKLRTSTYHKGVQGELAFEFWNTYIPKISRLITATFIPKSGIQQYLRKNSNADSKGLFRGKVYVVLVI